MKDNRKYFEIPEGERYFPFKPIYLKNEAFVRKCIGRKVKDETGKIWICVDYNDNGCLYFARSLNPRSKWWYNKDWQRKIVKEVENDAV